MTYEDVSFVGVYYHEEERLPKLLELASQWFSHIVVAIQTLDPKTDPSLPIVRQYTTEVYIDVVRGLAEPTLRSLLYQVKTPWSFVISGDEYPSELLLSNIGEMLELAKKEGRDGYWIRFRSSIEGIEYPSEQDNHLRLFRTDLGWPLTMHSRPEAKNDVFWPADKGTIAHERSLDEMMVDYLRYLKMSGSEKNWRDHNRLMMHDACAATAKHYGWPFVEAHSWWPTVRDVAFDECRDACHMEKSWYDCFSHR